MHKHSPLPLTLPYCPARRCQSHTDTASLQSLGSNKQHVVVRCVCVSLSSVYTVDLPLGGRHNWLLTRFNTSLSLYSFFFFFFWLNRTEEEILQLQLYHAGDVSISCWGKTVELCLPGFMTLFSVLTFYMNGTDRKNIDWNNFMMV